MHTVLGTFIGLTFIGLASAFSPTGGPRVGAPGTGRVRLVLAKEDDDGGISSAFAAFANKNKKLKKGEGAPERGDVEGLPIRMGGATRDGSLGDLRAAANTLKTLSNPRDWQAEEYGLIAVILSFVAGTAFFYYSYVYVPPISTEVPVTPAQAALTRAINACGDQACIDRVTIENEPAIVQERQLDDCMGRAFSNTERNMCKSKYGGALTPFGF